MQAQTEFYRDSIRSTAHFVAWTLAWLVTLAVARFGPGLLWDPEQATASWVAIAVNVVVGLGWIVAFKRFLDAQDELQRKILQDALAVTLGVGWVGGFAVVIAGHAGLLGTGIDVAVLPVVLGIVFLVAVASARLRYR